MALSSSPPTLNHLFFHHLDNYQQDSLLASAHSSYSTDRFALAVYRLNRYFASLGLKPGDRIGLLSENRPEWHIADFAILLGRWILVPIYPTLSPSQIEYLLSHSGCRAVVVSNQKQWNAVRPLRANLPELQHVISMDQVEPACSASVPGLLAAPGRVQWDEVKPLALTTDPGATAAIVYTSGTTGTPKGVMLSHRNIVFDYEKCIERLGQRDVAQALSVLPLSHVLESLLCYAYFRLGIRIAYGDPLELRELLTRFRPQAMGCVPRVLERVREAIEAQVRTLPRWKQALSSSLIAASIRCDKAECYDKTASSSDHLLRALARKLVYPKFHAQLGGIRYLICGGAWLDPEVEHFFRAAGFIVLQGYGLTETSPVICLSPHGAQRPGTVGPPIDGAAIRTGDNGEVLVRGDMVMQGYYCDPDATAAAFQDGWLRTGDTGRIDAGGYLTITGRCKEILVLSTGKNVSCAAVEQALLKSSYIQTCFVVGDGQKFVSVLIVPHRANVEEYAASLGLPCDNFDNLLVSPAVIELFQREIEAQQASLSHYEQVKRFCYLREEVLLDNELMTPTLKVRRSVLGRKFAPWIRQMAERITPEVIPVSSPAAAGDATRNAGVGTK